MADPTTTPMDRGRANEAKVLSEMGLEKNTEKVSSSEGNSVPDALTDTESVEIKDTKTVSGGKQVRIQSEAARASGRQSKLVTGEKTHVTKEAQKAFDYIVRHKKLGPQ